MILHHARDLHELLRTKPFEGFHSSKKVANCILMCHSPLVVWCSQSHLQEVLRVRFEVAMACGLQLTGFWGDPLWTYSLFDLA